MIVRIFLGLLHLCVTTDSFVRELLSEQQQYTRYNAPVVKWLTSNSTCCVLSPGFEPQVGRTFDFICKNKSKKDSIVESALQRG